MKGRKQSLYHVTTPENAKEILKNGLKRQNKPWVYLSERPTSWWQPGLEILEVRITGLKEEMRTFLPELDEILYFGDIPPERIKDGYRRLPRRYVQKLYRNCENNFSSKG